MAGLARTRNPFFLHFSTNYTVISLVSRRLTVNCAFNLLASAGFREKLVQVQGSTASARMNSVIFKLC